MATLIALTLIVFQSAGPAVGREQLTIGEAVGAVREAAATLEARVGELPRQAQLEVGTEVHFLARSASKTLQRLSRQPLAAASAGVEEDLLFLRDLLVAVGGELDRLGARGARFAGEEVGRLSAVAEERIGTIERALERQATALDASVVTAERTAEGLVLHTVDRTLYEGVRLAGTGLLLVGLLVVGLRLLSISEAEMSIVDLVRQTPVAAVGGFLAIGLFLAASAVIVVDPGPVAALAQRTHLQPAPAACERLSTQREQLLDARTIGHQGLSDTIKDRMRPVARDCLGLDSQVAAVEAVEWLSTSLDPLAGRTGERRMTGSVEPSSVDAEIERLMSAVDQLTEASDRGASLSEGTASGGPIEALSEEQAGEAPDRLMATTTRV
ncbi:MAG: hypothetical protein R3349_08835, partial [Geminicoccaceae bacterium]|nr:hypothetical protein [Geminicoccaceae bacterium]